ncbi:response regulator transcription factor [Pseudomonas sp. R5(2019)]|uniref:response regulator transcription factor n=1 Tax=Pseudomonas sp. R5(2019) TaxID=2697566 RepID=UPI001411B5DB|nr:response regulator [Pseudomonas sp. R5(2019)]NBA96592.1 response regulator [Pseudomonas sp. R5(2019)]
MSTILIIDDEYLIAEILGMALEDEGYEVVKAANGAKGLELIEQAQPHLVITDYMMPVMNGLEFAQKLRQSDQRVPIILMSGAQANQFRDDPLFAAVFDKPFRTEDIIATVRSFIQPAA